jgi:frizzled protein 5/8
VDKEPPPPASKNKQEKCEKITVPMCRTMPYNQTSMPNQFNHETQQEAASEAHQFWALVEINCAAELRFFLCSMYTPICLPSYAQPIRACKSVCVRARIGCEKYMKKFGFEWPAHMDCNLFPEYGSSNQVCMDPMDAQFQTTHKDKQLQINHNLVEVIPVIQVTKQVYTTTTQEKPSQSKVFIPFDKNEKMFTFYWLLIWSMLCLISSLCTALTYLVQYERFKYPEKPIIFLSICYLFVASGYLLKLMRSSSSTTTESTSSFECTLSFILIYYFGMASSVWWVIVSFTWFLAAGLKWGSEAIAKYHVYFHLLAWLLPFVKACVILAFSYVDRDPLSDVCLVGNASTRNLFVFLLAPSLAYLLVGITFLTSGFISLFRIRKQIKQSKQKPVKTEECMKARKLEKLMMRIGVFSILYTVPATCVIACQFYEKMYRDDQSKKKT